MLMTMPQLGRTGLGIVVSWRDRTELASSLPTVARCAARHGGDVTIVNYGGSVAQLEAMLPDSGGDWRIVNVDERGWFNKSRAQNIGAAHTGRDLLFFCDCDILIPDGALDELIERVSREQGTFGTVAAVTETVRNSRKAGNVVMFGYHLKLRLANGRSLQIIDNEEDADDGTRQAPGLLVVHRRYFEEIGGYNGRLHGWGWEDQDMIARLTLSGGLNRVQHGRVQHLSHDDDARIRHYPPVRDRWESRDRMFRQALGNYDRADFAGTFREDASRAVAPPRAVDGRPPLNRTAGE
jgi:glycosyltransferase involved in cell wall biosynthesis